MSTDLTEYLSLQSKIRQLETKVRSLEQENCRLRSLCGKPRVKGLKKEKIIKLLTEGFSVKEIAEIVGCHERTVYTYKKALGK